MHHRPAHWQTIGYAMWFTAVTFGSPPAASAEAKASAPQVQPPARWTAERAWQWYRQYPWLVGCNYIPATAINSLEMWQAETFDPKTIDRELALAQGIGFNFVRVFLHDLLWKQDAEGWFHRIDRFLALADQHQIKVMFVFFDHCWNPSPRLGRQPKPKPFTHNSGWVQSPARAMINDPSKRPYLEGYLKAVLTRFKDDRRVIVWDLYNEPGVDSLALLRDAFGWARQVNPSQPLTVGAYGSFVPPYRNQRFGQLTNDILAASDVISFHCYDNPDKMEQAIKTLQSYKRPILCTEYMSRGRGCTFQGSLPVMSKYHVAAVNWGLVAGKTQTYYPWGWNARKGEPPMWFHDVFRQDGRPYRPAETEFIRRITAEVRARQSAAP